MAPDVTVRPVEAGDAADLAPRLRQADIDEVWAASRSRPEQALRRSVALSTRAWAGLMGGEVVALFGVAPVSFVGGTGAPWLLGSPRLEEEALAFMRASRPWRDEVAAGWRLLVNYVDARNLAALRWLRWLGFDIGPAEPHGPFRLPFHRFEMRGRDV